MSQPNPVLPIVSFEYPDSQSGILKTRLVKVIEMDSRYVQGFEIQNSKETKFKKFSLNRIPKNGVALVRFSDK